MRNPTSRRLTIAAAAALIGAIGMAPALAERNHDDDPEPVEAECTTGDSNMDNDADGLIVISNLLNGDIANDSVNNASVTLVGDDESSDEANHTGCADGDSNQDNDASGLIVLSNLLNGDILNDALNNLSLTLVGDDESSDEANHTEFGADDSEDADVDGDDDDDDGEGLGGLLDVLSLLDVLGLGL